MRERFNAYVDDLSTTGKLTILFAIAGFGLLAGTLMGGT